ISGGAIGVAGVLREDRLDEDRNGLPPTLRRPGTISFCETSENLFHGSPHGSFLFQALWRGQFHVVECTLNEARAKRALRTRLPVPGQFAFHSLADAGARRPSTPAASLPNFRRHPCRRLPSGRHRTRKLDGASVRAHWESEAPAEPSTSSKPALQR